MKTKILAVMATGLAVLFLGAAPNISGKSHKPANNSRAYGMYGNSSMMGGSYGRTMMNGAASDSSYQGMMGSSYRHGYGMMNGNVPDSTYRNMMRGDHGYGMMGGMGYGMMNSYSGRGYGMMGGRGYGMMPMMMSMMGMMRGRMMYGSTDSSFVCPYYNNARPQNQKEGK